MSDYTTDSPAQRSLRARIAAATLLSRRTPHEVVAPARAGLERRYEDLVDPERTLPPEERRRRVGQARKADMLRRSLKQVQRRERTAARAAETVESTP